MNYILEACVDSVESAVNSQKGGADRLELCSNLIIGGTSPSIELFKLVKQNVDIKINVLIRPRFGDFLYSDYEFEIIKNEIELFKSYKANGVVIGVLNADAELDMERMEKLMNITDKMEVTLHRAFDMTKDPFKALRQAEKLGIDTILTSGQKNSAKDGAELLNNLQNSTDKISIMVGGRVDCELIDTMSRHTNIKAYHLSGKETVDSKMTYRKSDVSMGLPIMSEYDIWQTSEENIRKARDVIDKNSLV